MPASDLPGHVRARRAPGDSRPARFDEWWLRAGAITSLFAIALQESVEFSLQMPGNAALFVVVCAISLQRAPAISDDPPGDRRSPPRPGRSLRLVAAGRKIDQMGETNSPMTVRIGFDMDGVLADFASAYREVKSSCSDGLRRPVPTIPARSRRNLTPARRRHRRSGEGAMPSGARYGRRRISGRRWRQSANTRSVGFTR